VVKRIFNWLRAGAMDGHTRCESEMGMPQCSVISPLLANIYLHYALDTWVIEWRLREARGKVYIIRYADDFVMGFQCQDDGKHFKRAAETRLGDFKLSLHSGKTQLIEFGRFAKNNREQRGAR
jgi:RNA-directed DNA polymerase